MFMLQALDMADQRNDRRKAFFKDVTVYHLLDGYVMRPIGDKKWALSHLSDIWEFSSFDDAVLFYLEIKDEPR